MRVFGLTGGVASGKGVVAARFRELGVPVIDADELAREVVAPGRPALEEIAAAFGVEMLLPDGSLDRPALAAVVFADPARREKLNALTHPRVAELRDERLATLRAEGHSLACYELPLLFENQLEAELRPVVLVAASRDNQVRRAMMRSGWTAAQANARIDAQLPLEEKRRRADFVIDNDGALTATRDQAERVLGLVRRWQPSDSV